MRRDASNQEVLALENYNLLASETVAATVCGSCKSKATYDSSLGPSCKRHIPKTHPIVQEDGKDVSKMPGMPVLKAVAKPLGLKGKTKDELVAALKTRHSLRAFLPTPVPRQTVEDILEVARWAPSGTNTQPWQVHVLTGEADEALFQVIDL
jgi:hypothetical protein